MECPRQPMACSSSISMKGTKRSPRRRLLLSSRVLLGHIGVGRGHWTRLWGSARPGVSNCRSHSPADPRARGVGSREPAIKSARARFCAYLRRAGGRGCQRQPAAAAPPLGRGCWSRPSRGTPQPATDPHHSGRLLAVIDDLGSFFREPGLMLENLLKKRKICVGHGGTKDWVLRKAEGGSGAGRVLHSACVGCWFKSDGGQPQGSLPPGGKAATCPGAGRRKRLAADRHLATKDGRMKTGQSSGTRPAETSPQVELPKQQAPPTSRG